MRNKKTIKIIIFAALILYVALVAFFIVRYAEKKKEKAEKKTEITIQEVTTEEDTGDVIATGNNESTPGNAAEEDLSYEREKSYDEKSDTYTVKGSENYVHIEAKNEIAMANYSCSIKNMSMLEEGEEYYSTFQDDLYTYLYYRSLTKMYNQFEIAKKTQNFNTGATAYIVKAYTPDSDRFIMIYAEFTTENVPHYMMSDFDTEDGELE